MTETQEELNKEVGTAEPEKKEVLEPKEVKIVEVKFRDTPKGKVLECKSQHPDRDEPIKMSSVSYLRDRQVVTGGLWDSTDKDGKIQKGSALAVFLNKLGAKTPKELEGKQVVTELDDKQWLCFRAY